MPVWRRKKGRFWRFCNGPFESADEVRARIKYLDDDFGELFKPLNNPSPGEWRLDDITIGIAGAYQLDVTVVRSDSFDSHPSTRFTAASKSFTSDLIRPSAQTAMSAFGVLIAVAGIGLLAVAVLGRKPIRLQTGLQHGVAIVVVALGAVVVVNALTIGIGLPTEDQSNPFPLTQETVVAGRTTYETGVQPAMATKAAATAQQPQL